jgi:hypothetical protein
VARDIPVWSINALLEIICLSVQLKSNGREIIYTDIESL